MQKRENFLKRMKRVACRQKAKLMFGGKRQRTNNGDEFEVERADKRKEEREKKSDEARNEKREGEYVAEREEMRFTKEFWRDTMLFFGFLFLFYIVYIAIEYWPNIVEGFNRGWNSK